MLLDSGVLSVFEAENTAEKGEKPVLQYKRKIAESYYAQKTVGTTRFWNAKAQDNQIDLLLRIQRNAHISPAHRCFVQDFTSTAIQGWYKILQAQQLMDEDGLPATELSLQRLEGIDSDAFGYD